MRSPHRAYGARASALREPRLDIATSHGKELAALWSCRDQPAERDPRAEAHGPQPCADCQPSRRPCGRSRPNPGHATSVDPSTAQPRRSGPRPRERGPFEALSAGGSLSIADLIALAKETNMAEATFDAIAQRRYEQARPRTA